MYTFAISSVCLAMDCITELTYVQKPTSVAFLDDYRIVMGGEKCITFNLINAKIKLIDPTETFHITVSNNTTKFALASKKQLAIFSTFTEKKRWKQKPLREGSSIAFSQNDLSLFAYCPGKLTVYNCCNKKIETHGIQSSTEFQTTLISCHPSEKKLLYPSSDNTLSTINLENYSTQSVYTTKDRIIAGIYSPNGNIIAVNNHYKGCCLYNPQTNHSYNLLTSIYENIVAASFHKSRPLFAILLDNNTVQYWSYGTNNALIASRIYTTHSSDHIAYPHLTERLAFSPNGEKLLVALKNKCLLLEVPKNNIAFFYFVLKQYVIVPEIIKLILHKLALSFKFHQIDFAELIKT